MEIHELLDLLDRSPAVVDIHPASLCFSPDDVVIIEEVEQLVWRLDSLEPVLPTRYLLKTSHPPYSSRFPSVRCEHDPITPALNTILPKKFDTLAEALLVQSKVAQHIVRESSDRDLIVLVLIDGLSYHDVRSWHSLGHADWTLEACLVDVPTITRLAFPNLIGSPSIAERLFNQGFHQRLGFSYWTREDNKLTDLLFSTIIDLNKVSHFSQILSTLNESLSGTRERQYVQIMRSGLDGFAHAQKRLPPTEAVVAEIEHEFAQLVNLVTEFCAESEKSADLYLTADHGILWLKDFSPTVIGSAPSWANPRYCDWRGLHQQAKQGRRFIVGEKDFYSLHFPDLRRPPRIDEQGVHGGISYQESIVPLIRVKVRTAC